MPYPSPLPPGGRPVRVRPPRAATLLLLLAAAAAVAGVALAGLPAQVALIVMLVALLAGSVAAMRAHWTAVLAEEDRLYRPAPLAPPPGTDLPARLRRLHDEHLERVNAALDEGRTDVAAELSDAYMDEALRAITEAEPAADPAPRA